MKYVGMSHFAPFAGSERPHGWRKDGRFGPMSEADIDHASLMEDRRFATHVRMQEMRQRKADARERRWGW